MVGKALFTKSLRDMNKSRTQFISILIMATIAVSVVTGIDCIWKTIDVNAGVIYEATNIADMWVNVVNPTEQEMWSVSRIPGVEKTEKRFMTNSPADLEGAPTLRVYTVSGQSTMDLPKLVEGRRPGRGGAVLDEAFAAAHGLKINDSIRIKLNGRWVRLPIDGLALSSEHIHSVNGTTDTFPNPKKYGFVIINDETLKSAYGMKIYNQISVRLAPGADTVQMQARIDKVIGDNLIGIIARDDNASVNNINTNIQQFKLLAQVFSLMFFIITALITQSTMVRMVENQRTQIGILKALGYKKRSILWHYASYGVYMGLLGSFLGLVIGPNLFGRILVPALKLNLGDDRLMVNYPNFIIALGIIILCTGGVSFYACLKIQGDTPAVLLRAKPPREGNHIFLEYLPRLWNGMKFSHRLIARNTLRNKMRFIMSVLGITGCTGLIVAAFTITDMINGIALQTYNVTYKYDHKVVLDPKTDARFMRNLKLDGTVQQVQEAAVQIITPGGERKMELLTVTPKESPLIHFKDMDGNGVLLPDDGISITRKLAETLDIKVGDTIRVKRTDESYIRMPIRQIVYMAVRQGMYMTDACYKSMGETFKPTAVLVKWVGQPDYGFLTGDYADEHVDRDSQIADIQSSTKIVYTAGILLIIMGAILAFVVLYNSSILNFSERIRDLTTLQVLGFYKKEIRSLVLTENILSVIMGLVFGIPMGKALADIVAGSLDEQMDLISHISLGTAAFSIILTAIFALIVNGVVAKKMGNIDMLEALKSVE